MHSPSYLPFYFFHSPFCYLKRSLLTQHCSLFSKPSFLCPGFFSLSSERTIRDPCENIRSLFFPSSAHPRSVPLTRQLTTEPAPGFVSPTLATLDASTVPVQLCSSFPDSHFSSMNSQGCFVAQSPARLPPFQASLHSS